MTNPLELAIRLNVPSPRRTRAIASMINSRFGSNPVDRGDIASGRLTGQADASTSLVTVSIPWSYKDRPEDFLRLVAHINPDAQNEEGRYAGRYIRALTEEPGSADRLAWALEALGPVVVRGGTTVSSLYDWPEIAPRMFLRIFSALATAVLGSSPIPGGETVLSVVQLALSVVLVVGWWVLSAPMPLLADLAGADRRRRWVRGLLVVNVAVIAAQASLYVLMSVWLTSPLALLYVVSSVTILSSLVSLAGYVVQMLYLAWLADRVPDVALFKRAKLLVWLGPTLSTVGLVLLGLGPLIALIMRSSLPSMVT